MAVSPDDGSPRSRARGEAVARRFARTGDPSDLDELVVFYRPLAQALSRRYTGLDRAEDLEQVAAIGLIKAARRFDPARGPFRAYAIPTMVGEIKHFCRANDWSVHVPRPLQELLHQIRETGRELQQLTGRAPTVTELAKALELDAQHVAEALCAEQTALALSLDHVGAEDAGLALAERVGCSDLGYSRVESAAVIESLLPALSPIERRVIGMRFAHDLTQREIGEQLGIPARRVGKILRSAIDRLSVKVGARTPRPRRAIA